ncbi:MAG: hypothetical protein IJL67_13655 [Oscillospiraceae bacterium]|nr:hypothetical protein [Oscillospiraceae bacterium]
MIFKIIIFLVICYFVGAAWEKIKDCFSDAPVTNSSPSTKNNSSNKFEKDSFNFLHKIACAVNWLDSNDLCDEGDATVYEPGIMFKLDDFIVNNLQNSYNADLLYHNKVMVFVNTISKIANTTNNGVCITIGDGKLYNLTSQQDENVNYFRNELKCYIEDSKKNMELLPTLKVGDKVAIVGICLSDSYDNRKSLYEATVIPSPFNETTEKIFSVRYSNLKLDNPNFFFKYLDNEDEKEKSTAS